MDFGEGFFYRALTNNAEKERWEVFFVKQAENIRVDLREGREIDISLPAHPLRVHAPVDRLETENRPKADHPPVEGKQDRPGRVDPPQLYQP